MTSWQVNDKIEELLGKVEELDARLSDVTANTDARAAENQRIRLLQLADRYISYRQALRSRATR